jgi:hypothetical protein
LLFYSSLCLTLGFTFVSLLSRRMLVIVWLLYNTRVVIKSPFTRLLLDFSCFWFLLVSLYAIFWAFFGEIGWRVFRNSTSNYSGLRKVTISYINFSNAFPANDFRLPFSWRNPKSNGVAGGSRSGSRFSLIFWSDSGPDPYVWDKSRIRFLNWD